MEDIKAKHMKLRSVIKAGLSIMGKNMTPILQLAQELLIKVATVGIFFKVCLNPEEGLRTPSYYRAEFLSAQNSNV